MFANTISAHWTHICVFLKKLWGKQATSIQTWQTFLWVFKASWTILKSIWHFCSWAWGEAIFQEGVDMCRRQMFSGQASYVRGSWAKVVQVLCVVAQCVCDCVLTHFSTCLPLTSWAPASVKSMLITSSKLQLGSDAWLSWPTWCNIRFRTSSREAAVSSSKMVALARKPSRSRCARTSSSKFISFTYCGQEKIKLFLTSFNLTFLSWWCQSMSF